MGWVWVLAMVATPVGARPAAVCPESRWDFCGTSGSSIAPVEHVICECDPVFAAIGYDHAAGTSGVGAGGSSESGSCAGLTSEDDYWVVGPNAGPISITAILTLDVDLSAGSSNYGCSSSHATSTLSSGTASQSAQFSVDPCGYGTFHRVVSLDLAHPVGEPFQVAVALFSSCGPNGSGQISSAALTFGLPPGYQMTSCQAYSVPPVTPARASSWGAVKLRYR